MKYPLKFEPLLKVRPWGGDTVSKIYNYNGSEPIGESWEIADHDEDISIIANGPLKGKTLRSLFTKNCFALAGNAVDPSSPDKFPLMLKLLDSKSALSVQVHPDDCYADKKKKGELGKTEAWYILEADQDACIYYGLKNGITKEAFENHIKEGTVDQCMNKINVSGGEVFYIPAGTVHALGPGVRMAEIQQNSDTTFRIFDWNRTGLDGKPRELHVADSLAVTDYTSAWNKEAEPQIIEQENALRECFISSEKFAFEKISAITKDTTLDTGGKTFHIITAINGEIKVKCEAGEEILKKWQTCLVPACCGQYQLEGNEKSSVLLFYIPERTKKSAD
ncbi:MAG: type I phosphomannose isomerase catalytic subunit [Planctomycetota bacterium]|jgi:mannose-6-phosphate isomerase